ncbi:MAG: beta-L-arabinofuranosidase domain-containing protein [Oscillospiraceae bacterium]
MEWKQSSPVSFEQVDVTGGFWRQKQELMREVTAQAIYDRFAETGRFAALKADWKEGEPNKPHIFWESDVAKWIEGVAYLLDKQRDAHLEGMVDEAIDLMERYQQEDGYLNVYFTVVEPEARFTRCTDHELYCAGHLIEAAVAYDRATGKDKLLHIMERYIALIDQVFRVEHSANFDTPGHEEIELALYRLYRHTRREKYLRLAEYFVDTRGTSKKDHTYDFAELDYMQAHLPVREQTTAEGHSVRALYLYIAMADLAHHNRDEALYKACETLFDNIVEKRMYITGGVGSTHRGRRLLTTTICRNTPPTPRPAPQSRWRCSPAACG